MSNRYAIHLETPAGLQFDGMVEADSLYEAAMKWARDIGYEAGKARLGIAVQDPSYNEEGKLRFSALSAGNISDVYGATECIYVASEFDPKALFREMAVQHEKPEKEREEFTVQDLKGAVSKLKAMELKPDENGRYRFRMNEVGNIELVSEAEKQEPEPIDHDFESVPLNPLREKLGSVLILPAKDDAELSKRLEECATKIDSAPFGLLVEFNRECTVFDIDDIGLLARGEIEAVNPTRDHLAGIRIRRDAQDDYIYIFPSVSVLSDEQP